MNTGQEPMEPPVRELDSLPRTRSLDRDLWPGIAERLGPRERAAAAHERRSAGAWRLGAVAAGVGVAFLAGLLLGRQDGALPDATTTAAVPPVTTASPVSSAAMLSPAEAAAPSLAAAVEATEREYRAAYKGFETVGIAPSLLEARTVEDLDRSWQAMKEAETALKTALGEHPDNPYLAQKLLDLRAQQLDFMRRLHMLAQDSRRST